MTEYTITSPVGNILAPAGKVSEKTLREFGVQFSAEVAWKEKFEKDPIEQVLEYLARSGYVVKAV